MVKVAKAVVESRNAFESAVQNGRVESFGGCAEVFECKFVGSFRGVHWVVHDALVGLQGRAPSHAPHPPCELPRHLHRLRIQAHRTSGILSRYTCLPDITVLHHELSNHLLEA
jgi:hypothetical protein